MQAATQQRPVNIPGIGTNIRYSTAVNMYRYTDTNGRAMYRAPKAFWALIAHHVAQLDRWDKAAAENVNAVLASYHQAFPTFIQ